MTVAHLCGHLPLVVPPGCRFRVGNSVREWVVGQAWVFDDTIEHEAHNTSDELRAILARMAVEVPAGMGFHDGQQAEQGEQRAGFSALFSSAFLRDTVGMWICFFMTLLSIYSAFSWLPTMLTAEGLSPKPAAMGLTAYNLGGVVGVIACALAINRFGSRKTTPLPGGPNNAA